MIEFSENFLKLKELYFFPVLAVRKAELAVLQDRALLVWSPTVDIPDSKCMSELSVCSIYHLKSLC